MRKVMISAMIGNGLEWYDYALYAQFSYIIGIKFFPKNDFVDILTFAVFAAGFVVRPLGAVVFGQLGDRLGRKMALVLGIVLMAVPTAGIGLLPSYDTIGIAAPIILTIIRLIQGFSLGGEFSGCIAYTVEHAPADKRGIAGSASFVSLCLGIIVGLVVAQAFTYCLSTENLLAWGWRIPFISGLFIGFVGLYIRTHLAESPLYKAAKAKGLLSRTPLREALTIYWREVLMAIAVYINVAAPFYTMTVYIKNYMRTLGYSQQQGVFVGALVLIVMTLVFPMSAYLSDRIGRKPVLVWSSLAVVLFTYPMFSVLHLMNYGFTVISQVAFAVILGFYMGPVPTVIVELFPTRVRFTGVAISYNLSAALFGGTAPVIGEFLYRATGYQISLAYYLTTLAFLCSCSLYFYKETYRKNLMADIS
jgi:MHS family proline/betaine transporter-like MFS transporter